MCQPRVSILMLTYNRPLYIGRAIASVCAQSFHDWELLVVQDGSHPQTSAIVSECAAREPRIRHYARGTVGSIADASNFGLARARGEYIAILDDDDAWSTPDKLARQVEFLDTNPEYIGCGGGYILVDAEANERGKFLKPELDPAIRARALLANPIANSTAMFRRSPNGKSAVYDTSLSGYADWDFWLHMGSLGKLYNFPLIFAYYSLWEGGGSFRQHKINARSGVRIVCKHRRAYRGFGLALVLALLQYGYASLPLRLRRLSYRTLSSFKKTFASSTVRTDNA
jgi:glycosyltransferase involved in cell wall biosynthesis